MRFKVLIASAGLIAAALGAWWLCLPKPLFHEPYSTVVLARDGELLGARIADDGQWRFPSDAPVPDRFAKAIVAFEDKRFFEHNGVDLLAIGRAARSNFARGRVVSGGSTLTMQLSRLIRQSDERTLTNKLFETALALRLEASFNKQQILSLYAAHAPFGGNVIGLEAAAWRYFGRGPDHLSWAETCTLAVLPNSPALIHPGRNRTLLLNKRDRLLRKLHEQGALSRMDLEVALREPLPGAPIPLPQVAPHLLETLRAGSTKDHLFQTTIDATIQAAALQIVRDRADELAQQDIHNAAAIVIDNRTFEVIAYIGNARWSVNNEHGFAVDILQRPRSTGSILKPMLYAAMLESSDILPHTLIPDVPTQYAGYMPENFDRTYSGAVPADIALAQSLNVPAVRMLRQYGVERFYELLRHAGLSTLTRQPDEYGLTLILGGAEGKLWDIAGAYANLASIAMEGVRESPPPYRRLMLIRERQQADSAHANDTTSQTSAGQAFATPAEFGPGAAWLTLNALLEVPRPAEEGHWKNFATARKIAWKTGTSWGFRDAWAVGVSSRYTVGVWVGNATGEGRPGLTGSTAAAPLLFQLFNRLDASPWFERPERDLKPVETCANDGYLANGNCGTQIVWAPRSSHFSRTSPYNIPVHLDAQGLYRVNDACEPVTRMRHTSAFVLPPAQEFYFRRGRADYRAPPPYRPDCSPDAVAANGKAPMDFLYPNANTRVYIPIDLAAQKGRVVFEAVHRDANATLFWHLDQHYVATTRAFHTEALDISPGMHVITVVDQAGNRVSRPFEVIGEPTGQSARSRSN